MSWLWYNYDMIIKWLFTDYQWYIMIPDDRMVWWNIHEYPCPMMSHDPWHSCPFGTKTISPFHLCHNPSYHFTRFHKESKPWDGIGSCNTFNTFHHISPHFTTFHHLQWRSILQWSFKGKLRNDIALSEDLAHIWNLKQLSTAHWEVNRS